MPDSDLLPPSADSKKAEKYIAQFVSLLNHDKLRAVQTDLSKFDPSALQDHYRLDFSDYSVEVSHSKQPNSGADSFVLLFTNIKNVAESGDCEKIILAYLHLEQNQFTRFKSAAEDQMKRFKKIDEENRFNAAVNPIDQILDSLQNPTISSYNQNVDAVPGPQQTQLETDLEKNGMYLSDFSNNQPAQEHQFPEKMATKPATDE